MKPVANIITSSNKIDINFNYNKCKTMGEIDKSLPTLIIGYKNASEYINNFKITHKCYPEQNIWWTFLKTEKRIDYDNDIRNFNKIIIDNLIKDVSYSLFDIINFDKQKKKEYWNDILSNSEKIIYNYYNKFLFIYFSNENKVIGLPINTCKFIGVDIKKILNKLKENKNNKFIKNINSIPFLVRRDIDNEIHKLLVLYPYFCS